MVWLFPGEFAQKEIELSIHGRSRGGGEKVPPGLGRLPGKKEKKKKKKALAFLLGSAMEKELWGNNGPRGFPGVVILLYLVRERESQS